MEPKPPKTITLACCFQRNCRLLNAKQRKLQFKGAFGKSAVWRGALQQQLPNSCQSK